MEISVLTYNLLYNKALGALESILDKYEPDIICLQEVDTDESNLKKLQKFNYILADYSNSFIKFDKVFGVATFYSPKNIGFICSSTHFLPRSVYELLLTVLRLLTGGNQRRTFLETSFVIKTTRQKLTVYNVHLTLIGSNGARIKQIREAATDIKSKKNPTVLAGDFNYFPYSRRRLERAMRDNSFQEATKSIFYTIMYSQSGKKEKYNLVQRFLARFIRKYFGKLKVDYVFYRNLTLKDAKRIDVHLSDHFPILTTFKMN